MRNKRSLLAASAIASMLLMGCGNGDVAPADDSGAVNKVEEESPTSSSSSSAETDLPSEEDVEAYFTAVSTTDVSGLERAMKVSEPGSIAEAYAGYHLGSANAAIDGGMPNDGKPPTKVDGGWESCFRGDCVVWADIEGRDGKIVSFTINGEKLNDRLSAGSGNSVRAGELGVMKMLYAYKSVQSDALFVVSEVRSGPRPVTIGTYESSYRSPEGRQSAAADFTGPSELAADSTATVVVAFQNADPGGVASIPWHSQDFSVEQVVQLKTR